MNLKLHAAPRDAAAVVSCIKLAHQRTSLWRQLLYGKRPSR
jgi:hypothetical protein